MSGIAMVLYFLTGTHIFAVSEGICTLVTSRRPGLLQPSLSSLVGGRLLGGVRNFFGACCALEEILPGMRLQFRLEPGDCLLTTAEVERVSSLEDDERRPVGPRSVAITLPEGIMDQSMLLEGS